MSITQQSAVAFVAAPTAPLTQLRATRPSAEQQAAATAPSSAGASGSSAVLGCLAMATGAVLARQVKGSRRASRAARRAAPSWLPGVESEDEKAARLEAEAEAAEAKRYAEFCAARDALNLPSAVPFLAQPTYREFMYNVPGDCGFDPIGYVQYPENFEYQRRAELTHGRFAMLAAVGWPLAELYHTSIAQEWGLKPALAAGGRAPSLLNGGFVFFDENGPTSTSLFFAAVAVMGFLIEGKYDTTFDPLKLEKFVPPGMAKMLPEGREWMAEAEIKHGRIAMVAITTYVIEEVVSKAPVVVDTPFLFQSIF